MFYIAIINEIQVIKRIKWSNWLVKLFKLIKSTPFDRHFSHGKMESSCAVEERLVKWFKLIKLIKPTPFDKDFSNGKMEPSYVQ